MAKKTSKKDQATFAAYQLVEDAEVQKQLRVAVARLQEAWSRASGRPPAKAATDKKVYAKVREAATSLAAVGGRLRKKPEPPKRTGRKVVAAAAVAGGAAYAFKKTRSSGSSDNVRYNGQSVGATPAPYPSTPQPAT
jgi:hypothetical protein